MSLARKSTHLIVEDTTNRPKNSDIKDPTQSLQKKRTIRRIWNHLTISRDETSSSEWNRELLAVIFSSRLHLDRDKEGPTASIINKAVISQEQFVQLSHQDQAAAHRRQAEYQHHQSLVVQTARLQQIRQIIPEMSSAQKHSEYISEVASSDEVVEDGQPPRHKSTIQQGCLAEITTTKNKPMEPPPLQSEKETYQALMSRITSLEAENQSFKVRGAQARAQDLYFISNDRNKPPMGYLDEPTWSIGPNRKIVLTAHFPITDIVGFLAQKHDIAFVIARYYSPQDQEDEVAKASRAKQALPHPRPSSEHITLHSRDMISAAEEFFAKQLSFAEEFPEFNIRNRIPAPYLFWYYYRSPEPFQGMDTHHQQLMELLTSWIEDNYGEKYDLVARQLKNGVISQETMPFLVRPRDVLVWEDRHKFKAAVAKSWPIFSAPPGTHIGLRGGHNDARDWVKTQTADKKITCIWSVDSWHYEYDGQFLREAEPVKIVLKSHSPDEEIPIQSLKVYPLRYASSKVHATLEHRGNTFWSCRHQRLVSYEDENGLNGVSILPS